MHHHYACVQVGRGSKGSVSFAVDFGDTPNEADEASAAGGDDQAVDDTAPQQQQHKQPAARRTQRGQVKASARK